MRLGVISDTHGMVEDTRRAVRMFESLDVENVIHCGDIGVAAIVDLFEAWPTHFVLGNVDYAAEIEQAVERAGQHFHGRFGSLQLAGVQVAFLHGDDQHRLNREVKSGRWQLLCHGHTHQAQQTVVGETLVLNPGALRRTTKPTAAIVDLPELRAQLFSL